MIQLPVVTWLLNGGAAAQAHDPAAMAAAVTAILTGAGADATVWDARLTGSGDGKSFLATLDIDAAGTPAAPPATFLASALQARCYRGTSPAQLEAAIAAARADGELLTYLALRCDATSGDGREWWSLILSTNTEPPGPPPPGPG